MEDNVVLRKKSLLEKVKLFFVKPSVLFEDYIEKPTWFVKTLIASIMVSFFGMVSMHVGKDLYLELVIQKMPQATPEAIEGLKKLLFSPGVLAISVVGAVIQFIIMTVISALVLFGILKVLGIDAKIKKSLAIMALGNMASAIGFLLKGVVMLAINRPIFANFKPTVTQVLLSNLDIFNIWALILMYFGITTVFKTDEKKSILAVVILWLITLGVTSIWTVLYK